MGAAGFDTSSADADASLDDLAAEAAAAEFAQDPAAPPGGEGSAAPAAPAERVETWEDWRDALQLALEWAEGPYPQLRPVMPPERVEKLARASHALAAKYGWTLGTLALAYKEELTFALVVWPVARDVRRALAAPAPEAAPARAAAPAAPAAAAVAPPPAPGDSVPSGWG